MNRVLGHRDSGTATHSSFRTEDRSIRNYTPVPAQITGYFQFHVKGRKYLDRDWYLPGAGVNLIQSIVYFFCLTNLGEHRPLIATNLAGFSRSNPAILQASF
jgi:hypothetical protein